LGSPASNGGRGLKRRCSHCGLYLQRFARQQWRAWIETMVAPAATLKNARSPASNGGRGLKLSSSRRIFGSFGGSPASNGGRGLKLIWDKPHALNRQVRPPAMAGVD